MADHTGLLTFDKRADVEVLDEQLRVHSGRHEDQLEVAVLADAVPQHGHQEVGEPVSLVDLIHNHCGCKLPQCSVMGSHLQNGPHTRVVTSIHSYTFG